MVKFTKSQQRRIDSCSQPRAKQGWIDYFTHINEMKQMPAHKLFMKELRKRFKELQQ